MDSFSSLHTKTHKSSATKRLGKPAVLTLTIACALLTVRAEPVVIRAAAANEAPAKAKENTSGQSRFTTLDGMRIHYVNYGKGSKALMLIHGWTMNIDNWRDQIRDFAGRYRVIALDLPGHGKSEKPAFAKSTGSERVNYSMDLFARAVEAVLRDAGVQRAVLVGHSMGTPIARQFYRKYPQQTLAIVIVDGVLAPLGDKTVMDQMLAGFRGPNFREVTSQMLTTIGGPTLPAEALERIKASSSQTPQYVLVGAMEGMADPSIWGDDKVEVPALAIMAKNAFFPPNIEELARGIAPAVEFYRWDSVGHFVMMEKPKEFNEAVLAFIKKNRLLP